MSQYYTYCQELLSFTADILWDLEFALLYVLIEHLDVIVVVWRYTNKHLIQDYSNLVNVTCYSDPLLLEHFRSEIGWAPTEALSYNLSLQLLLLLLLLLLI